MLRSQFPNQGLNLCPLQWKCRTLTTGLPGKSLSLSSPLPNFSSSDFMYFATPMGVSAAQHCFAEYFPRWQRCVSFHMSVGYLGFPLLRSALHVPSHFSVGCYQHLPFEKERSSPWHPGACLVPSAGLVFSSWTYTFHTISASDRAHSGSELDWEENNSIPSSCLVTDHTWALFEP